MREWVRYVHAHLDAPAAKLHPAANNAEPEFNPERELGEHFRFNWLKLKPWWESEETDEWNRGSGAHIGDVETPAWARFL